MIKRKKILKLLLSYTTIITVVSYLGISSYILKSKDFEVVSDIYDFHEAEVRKKETNIRLLESEFEYRKSFNDEVSESSITYSSSEHSNDDVKIEYIPGEIIVRLNEEVDDFVDKLDIDDASIERLAEDVFLFKSKNLKDRAEEFFTLKEIDSADNDFDPYTSSVISKAESNGAVYAQPNFIYGTSFLANDEYLHFQWALNNTMQFGGREDADIDAFEAWDIRPSPHTIKVAVIDTGVDYTHPDLARKIIRDGDNNVVGYDFVNDDADPMDDSGHGTHVTGIIAASRNNEIGIAGICAHCEIMPIKALNEEGGGSDATTIPAIQYALDHGARVINASWGGYGYSRALRDIINQAYENNVVFVASAGNNRSSYRSYPASFEHVISVAATTYNDYQAVFSNYGDTIDVSAPGVFILSTFLPGADLDGDDNRDCEDANFSSDTDGYGYCSGTSMAAPNVVGVVGLILSHNPDFVVDQVLKQITTAVDDLGDTGWDPKYGFGRINAHYAVDPSRIPVNIHANISFPNNGRLFGKEIDIRGTADATDFSHFIIQSYPKDDPDSKTQICQKNTAIRDNLLCVFNSEGLPELIDNTWIIELEVFDKDGNSSSDDVQVRMDNLLHPGWPKYRYYEDARHNNSPVYGDIDNDGFDEVVYGSVEGYVYAYNHDGTFVEGVWPVYIGNEGYGQANTPSIADMDNDGDMEVIVGAINGLGSNLLFVLNGDGTYYPGWPKFDSGYDYESAKWIMGECTVADIDQDGVLEILVGMYDYKLHAVHIDGTEVLGWPIEVFPPGEDTHNTYQNKFVTAPVVGDIDGDGDNEVVFGNWRYVYAYHHDGRDHPVAGDWPVDTIPDDLDLPDSWKTMGGISSPAMGDVDGDGLNEVVTTSGPRDIRPSTQYQTFVWNGDGSDVEGWPVYTYLDDVGIEQNIDEPLSPVALGDLDLDGYPEIVIGGREGGIYVWDGDGTQFHDETSLKSGVHWPIFYDYDQWYGMTKTPVIADIDDDNLPEILIGEVEGFKTLERDGTETQTKPNTNVEESPALGDIDRDGKFEIINFSNYEVNVWDVDSAYSDEKVEWGQFRNSAMHNGLYIPKDMYDIVDMVIDDLAGRLRRDRSIIELHEKEFVHWSDSCLGVRRDGEICAPEMIPGYKIILVVHYDSRDVYYEYHTDLSTTFRLKGRLDGEDLPERP